VWKIKGRLLTNNKLNLYNNHRRIFMYMSKKVVFSLILVLVFSLSACTASGQSFKNRLAEADGKVGGYSGNEALFAASTHSLQTFKNRLAEADGNVGGYSGNEAAYAKSKHSP
jgi:hypothetical protein